MKHKLFSIFCVIVMTAGATNAQAPTKTPPVSPGVVRNAGPSPEVQRRAAQISAYATAQCASVDATAAQDCRVKALWSATQCPDKMTETPADALKSDNSGRCLVSDPGFEYEVSSIKPRKDGGDSSMRLGPTSDGYRATNVEMISLVSIAFPVGPHAQFTGEPAWTEEMRFDVEAKFEPEVGEALMRLSRDDRALVQSYMLQKLLKERTNLVVHTETKEVPTYDLVVGKNGPKMKVAEPSTDGTGSRMIPRINQGRMVFDITRCPMSAFAANLSGPAGRPMFDKTGLTGIYDFKLEFVREQNLAVVPADDASGSPVVPPADPAGPTLQSAVEDQLGLKLVPSRGPIKIVVIDHIDKPSAN